jgi:antitoxin component YwqK of YwqJK toxin-antitoxin module
VLRYNTVPEFDSIYDLMDEDGNLTGKAKGFAHEQGDPFSFSSSNEGYGPRDHIGEKHGRWYQFYNGYISEEHVYDHGLSKERRKYGYALQRDGTRIRTLSSVIEYSDNGYTNKQSHVRVSGHVKKFVTSKYSDKSYRDVLHGLYCEYHAATRNKALELNFREGKLHGSAKLYFSNGNLREQVSFRNGKLHGHLRTYYTNGQPFRSIPYIKGDKLGWLHEWDQQGRLVARIQRTREGYQWTPLKSSGLKLFMPELEKLLAFMKKNPLKKPSTLFHRHHKTTNTPPATIEHHQV